VQCPAWRIKSHCLAKQFHIPQDVSAAQHRFCVIGGYSLRQLNSRLAFTPCARAICATDASLRHRIISAATALDTIILTPTCTTNRTGGNTNEALILTDRCADADGWHNHAQHHGNRAMATVASIGDANITVDTTDGKSQTIVLTPDTKYTNGEGAITLKDIKVGDEVLIQTTKKDDQLTAVMVKVGKSGTHHHSKLNKPSSRCELSRRGTDAGSTSRESATLRYVSGAGLNFRKLWTLNMRSKYRFSPDLSLRNNGFKQC
jgi:hypothetical protein